MSLLDILTDFSSEFDKHFDEFVEEFKSNIGKFSIEESIDNALDNTNFIENIKNILIDSVSDCYNLEYEDYDIYHSLLTVSWLDDLSLEDRLNEIADSIAIQMKDTLSANKIILDNIENYLDTTNDFDIDDFMNRFTVIIPYIDNMSEINKAIKSVKDGSGISTLSVVVGGLSTSILINILNNNLRNSVKNRYVTLNNTEGVRANYEAILRRTRNDPNIFGYRYNLSNIHSSFTFDICDVLTSADVGYGKGVYPKNKLPKFPFHPHCFCRVEPVYKDELNKKEYNKFNESNIAKYINSLDYDDKKMLFRKSDMESFKVTNNIGLMKDFGGFEQPTIRT